MTEIYREYFKKFSDNDCEDVVQYVPNASAEEYLLDNAPRLYCPDKTVEETFAFRTWTMRKHVKHTDDGYLITEFLVNDVLPWAGKHNTINAALTHHLNEFRWMKNADLFLDYISFFISGEGSAFAYHTPALTAMYNYCMMTANERYLLENTDAFERYYRGFEERHLCKNGLFYSLDNREGTEFTISGTTPDHQMLKGFRPLMNSCMYRDAVSLSEIFAAGGNSEKAAYYLEKAENIRKKINEKLWDGEFYKSVHPLDQNIDKDIDCGDISEELNARELMGYIPWAFGVPNEGRETAFRLLLDPRVFSAKTGLTTADMSNKRFLYFQGRDCTWNGHVWPYATSYAINAVIELMRSYRSDVITEAELYGLVKKYAEMHYSYENGKHINFIDEVMHPFEHVWYAREWARNHKDRFVGGVNRGKDYNHSTFIDIVLRGLCGVDTNSPDLEVKPRVSGIWKWFKIENLTYRKNTYNVWYDEDGTVFGKGAGVVIEKI